LPGWRITCLFFDKKYRGHGIARSALQGALDQIAHLGGGLVEAISEVTADRAAQALPVQRDVRSANTPGS
jgi:ribosomal protein S18 acetylase RimI-like enzyme